MLFLGLDTGGSKTHLLGRTEVDDISFTITGSGANLQRAGMQAASTVLAELINEAIRTHPGHSAVSVCAGVSGAGRSAEQGMLADRIYSLVSELNPDVDIHVTVVHDAEIALEGAFHGESGIIVIAGTGSVGFGRTTDGRTQRVGGWGYLLGDQGSGHTIGLRGLGAVCAALDGGPKTALTRLAAARFGIQSVDDAIVKIYREKMPAQDMAPVVIDAAEDGDEIALTLLREQAAELAEQIAWLPRRCENIDQRLALIGGLAGVPFYQDLLVDALQTKLPEWEIRRKPDAPVYGALRLAEKVAV